MSLTLKSTVRSDHDILLDKVTAAMETGNPGRAREVLADHVHTFPNEVRAIQASVLRDYNIAL